MNVPQQKQPTIYRTWSEVASRLFDLDLTPAVLREVVLLAYGRYAEWTPNDPKSARGFDLWRWGIRGLRDRLAPNGWKRRAHNNYETVVHESGLWQLAVSNADPRTGLDGPNPTTTTDKGTATKRAVALNYSQAQGVLFGDMLPTFAVQGVQTWYLLIHVDETAETIRSEISLPLGLDEHDHISWWEERILLPAISYGEALIGSPLNDDQDGGDLDIDVTRRVG